MRGSNRLQTRGDQAQGGAGAGAGTSRSAWNPPDVPPRLFTLPKVRARPMRQDINNGANTRTRVRRTTNWHQIWLFLNQEQIWKLSSD